MSAKLQKAFADGKVVVHNSTSSQVFVYTSEGNILIQSQGKLDLTKRVSVTALKKSANLRGLVKTRVLDVL